MSRSFDSFAEFYPFYLDEHQDRTCRRLHFLGTTLALFILVFSLTTGRPWGIAVALVCGYAFAWMGHYFFEKNRPATFKYPFYSFLGDWVMWRDMLTGRIRF